MNLTIATFNTGTARDRESLLNYHANNSPVAASKASASALDNLLNQRSVYELTPKERDALHKHFDTCGQKLFKYLEDQGVELFCLQEYCHLKGSPRRWFDETKFDWISGLGGTAIGWKKETFALLEKEMSPLNWRTKMAEGIARFAHVDLVRLSDGLVINLGTLHIYGYSIEDYEQDKDSNAQNKKLVKRCKNLASSFFSTLTYKNAPGSVDLTIIGSDTNTFPFKRKKANNPAFEGFHNLFINEGFTYDKPDPENPRITNFYFSEAIPDKRELDYIFVRGSDPIQNIQHKRMQLLGTDEVCVDPTSPHAISDHAPVVETISFTKTLSKLERLLNWISCKFFSEYSRAPLKIERECIISQNVNDQFGYNCVYGKFAVVAEPTYWKVIKDCMLAIFRKLYLA
ncbi:MAG: hypothetical protein H7A40_07215 [Chlamydiales bacterium]|nr:hypothetical protein [Chlamydiales bacterium]